MELLVLSSCCPAFYSRHSINLTITKAILRMHFSGTTDTKMPYTSYHHTLI